MNYRKLLAPALGMLWVCGAISATQADVIVRWDGTTNDIVPNGHQTIAFPDTFDTSSGFQSPAQGPDYYPNATPPDAPDFYAAKDNLITPGHFGIWNGGANDLLARYQVNAGNPGTYHAMFAWDFNADLVSLHQTDINDFGAADGRFRWLFQEKGGQWYASQFIFPANGQDNNTTVADVVWVAYTPHVAGVATFAPQAEGILGSNLDLQGVKMVGFYYEFDIVGTSTGGGMYLTGFRAEGTPGTPVLTGDLDGDGFVGINDLNLVLGNWNLNVPPGNSLADPSGDGFVGIEDLNTVLGNWNAGTPPPANAVPEPTTLGLMGLVGLAVSCRRR